MTITAAAKPGAESSLAKAYDPRLVETGVYDRWDDAGYFQPRERPDREPFVVVMPPPNVTGELHIGHALFVTVEDIMIRWHRMLGDPTLWIPGADHAGIAGQWVVEKELAKEGLTRHDLGREKFLRAGLAVHEPVPRPHPRAVAHPGRLGRLVPLRLHHGPRSVARGARRLQAPLRQGAHLSRRAADLLVPALPDGALRPGGRSTATKSGLLWTIAYPIEGADEASPSPPPARRRCSATPASPSTPTTTATAIWSARGCACRFCDRLIPIVADDAVDPTFGTGAVKVTPAHDPNDFEIGKRHGLPAINVMNLDGTMNANAGPFAGMAIADARSAVVERLQRGRPPGHALSRISTPSATASAATRSSSR